MSKIKKVFAREILDSRGNPTVEVEVELESGIKALAGVPSGASTGKFEALELRDNDPTRFFGKGVQKACENVNETIAEKIVGMDCLNQREIDSAMIVLDGTKNKSKLGANAILGVSLAVARAGALYKNLELYEYLKETFDLGNNKKIPTPMFNLINGGAHSDSGLSIQEFKVIPTGPDKFCEKYRAGAEIFQSLKRILGKNGNGVSVGDEGGFAPHLESNAEALEVLVKAIEEAGYKPGEDVKLGIDAAANSFFKGDDQYVLKPENVTLTTESLINLYSEWREKFYLLSVEDGLEESNWEAWAKMNDKIGQDVMLIGDDLLVTNVKRLKKALKNKSCNAVLVKPNQIGTLSETIDFVLLAQKNEMKVVVSHRSGETTDDFISDLAFAIGADFIKSGSLSRGERICKYNRLLRIEELNG